ncbi:hypothetical protein COMA2_10263 [Candidatus Nitrospira nitrificans]|uniref:Uncharacterized protein n=1 Tax=Candidatus Nitrospira nitrificans TaxID=1742973 RepID=A0A0S4L254_9BACT|nr:hypothetical protein COMA2_10263 [Candidatus Nitrospira nitrificans]
MRENTFCLLLAVTDIEGSDDAEQPCRKRTRRNHGDPCKVLLLLAAVKGHKNLAELADQFRAHSTPITE